MNANTPIDPPASPEELRRLELQTGTTVADFGAGSSALWAATMSDAVGADGSVLMFDVRSSALKAALKVASIRGRTNCKAVWTNLEVYQGASGVADNSLDAGILVNVLNGSKHPKDMLAEIHRMLKSGAKLMIIDWEPTTENRLAPPVNHRVASPFVETLAKSLGFAPMSKFSPNASTWGLILMKT